MKKSIFWGLAISLSLVMLMVTSGFAASANSFKYSESYKQKVLCNVYYCDEFDFGKFNISANLSLAGIDLSRIDRDTDFYLEVGGVYVDVSLSEGQYFPGKTSKSTSKANFVLSDYDYTSPDVKVPYMWVTLSWNSKKLTVKITGLTGTPDIMYPIIAYDYLYEETGVYSDDDTTMTGYVAFGETQWQFKVPSTVKVKQSTKKDKYKSEWDVGSVTAKGTGYEVPLGTE
jgi:hypothetical protein